MGSERASRLRLALPRELLADFARRWQVTELAVFGSALTDGFGPHSDIDFIVTFAGGARPGLFDLGAMELELADLVGRRVDLVERAAVEADDNYIRRRHILRGYETVYVA